MSNEINIRLTSDEALVLSALLDRWFNGPTQVIPADHFAHDSERAVLEIVLAAQLDKQVAEDFDDNYPQLVDQARQRLSILIAPFPK